VQEYRGFAKPKARDCDVKYITEYKVTKLGGFIRERGSLGRGGPILTTSRMQNLLLVSAAAIAVWITTGVLWGKGYL
jgi:tyrosine-protein phosphatase SIW14